MNFKPTLPDYAGPAPLHSLAELARPAPRSLHPFPAGPESGSALVHVTVAEIEAHLDRIAMEIATSPHGQEYLPLYTWWERQLEAIYQRLATMSAIADRVTRLRDRKEAPS